MLGPRDVTQDHTSRLALAWTFFASGILILGVSFVPVHWPSQSILGIVGVIALVATMVLGRTSTARAFMGRSPSGSVKVLKGIFATACVLALPLAIIGVLLLFQEMPLGDKPRLFPNAMLAPLSLYPLVCAYLVLAASGRSAGGRRRDRP